MSEVVLGQSSSEGSDRRRLPAGGRGRLGLALDLARRWERCLLLLLILLVLVILLVLGVLVLQVGLVLGLLGTAVGLSLRPSTSAPPSAAISSHSLTDLQLIAIAYQA